MRTYRTSVPLVVILLSLCGSARSAAAPAWERITLASTASIMNMSAHPSGDLFLTTNGNGIFRSTDGGTTWTGASAGLTDRKLDALHIGADGTIMIGSSTGAFSVSTDRGQTWTLRGTIGSGQISRIMSTSTGKLWATLGTDFVAGIYFSTDGGASWQRYTFTPESGVNSFGVAPDGALFASAGDNKVYRSTDDGVSWTQLAFESHTVLEFRAYSATDMYAGSSYGVYHTTDRGETWRHINLNMDFTTSIERIGPGDIAIANGSFFDSDDGVHRTTDNGATWSPMNDKLTDKNVTALLAPGSGKLFAGTASGRLFRADVEPPSITVTPPPNHAIVRDTGTVRAEASDNVSVAGVQFMCEGRSIGSEITVPPYSVFWDARSLSEGTHLLEAVARDAAGNRDTASTVVWILHETAAVGEVEYSTSTDGALRARARQADRSTLDFDLDITRDAMVIIDLADVAGRRIRTIDAGRVDAGSTTISVKDVPAGVVLYRVRAVTDRGDAVVAGKCVVE